MALDSAAALAILCHILGELWDAEWRESLSERESIIAYAWTGREGGQGGHDPAVQIWAWTRAAAASFRLQPLFSTSLKKIYQNTLGKNHCQPFHWHFWLTDSNNNFCFHLASHSSEKPLIVDKGPESPLPSDFWHRRLFFFQEPEELSLWLVLYFTKYHSLLHWPFLRAHSTVFKNGIF